MEGIVAERLAQLDTLELDYGEHLRFDDGHCSMEVVAWLAGEGHTDSPLCASEVLRELVIGINDSWAAEDRQRLRPYLPSMVGTGGDALDHLRTQAALNWLVNDHAPLWLDAGGQHSDAELLRNLPPIRTVADLDAADRMVHEVMLRTRKIAGDVKGWRNFEPDLCYETQRLTSVPVARIARLDVGVGIPLMHNLRSDLHDISRVIGTNASAETNAEMREKCMALVLELLGRIIKPVRPNE